MRRLRDACGSSVAVDVLRSACTDRRPCAVCSSVSHGQERLVSHVQRAHLVSPIAESDCDGLARSLTPRDRGIAVGSSQPACSSPAATQRPQHRRSPTRNTSGPCPGQPLATATVQQAPQPASATCLVRLLRSAATPSRPPVPGPLASYRAQACKASMCALRPVGIRAPRKGQPV